MFRRLLALTFSAAIALSSIAPSQVSAYRAESEPRVSTTEPSQDGATGDPVYAQIRSAKLSGESASITNFTLKRDTATITFTDGRFHFLSPVEGRVIGAVFLGNGEFQMSPVISMEQRHLGILTGAPSITETFTKMTLRFTDSTYDEIKKQSTIETGQSASQAQDAFDDFRNLMRKGKNFTRPNFTLALLRENIDARTLIDITWPEHEGFFQAFFNGKKHGDFLYWIDPLGLPFVTPEEVVLANLSDGNLGIWVASHLKDHYRSPAVFDENHQLFDLQHHKIEATMKGKRMDAKVESRFKAQADGVRVLPFSLASSLRVRRIADWEGRELRFIQEKKEEDAGLYVILAEGLKKGQEYTLTFEYGGDDAVLDSGGGNFTLAARSNWYPNTDFGDRATYEMTLKTSKDLILVATGQPMGEAKEGDWMVSKWKSDIPLAVAGFNYGKFKKEVVKDEKTKYDIESYANKELPDSLKSLQRTIESLEDQGVRTTTTLGSLNTVSMMGKARAEAQLSIALYTDMFGELPYGRIAMTQQPFFDFGQAWPMLVYMPLFAYLDSTFKNQLGLQAGDSFWKIVGPHEVAHQWWGHIIGWKSYRDQWMSEGFSDCSASIFAQAFHKGDLFQKFWKEQRELIIQKNEAGRRASDVGGVYMGYRLDTARTGSVTRRVIYPKGGFILHMLRMMMWDPQTGDQKFSAMMKDFVKTHYNQNVSTQDFQRIVEKHMTRDMDFDGNGKMNWFFQQWVYGTHIPDYKLTYRLDAAEGGKAKLVAKITQSNVDDNFRMRVPVYLDFDGRITRLGTVPVFGNSTTNEFEVMLPKKPKRVLLAYNEDVLCTTDAR